MAPGAALLIPKVEGGGNSWTYASNPPLEPESGRIAIVISAIPRLADGNRSIEIEYKGNNLRIISGNAKTVEY